MGGVVLDLREAMFAGQEVTIDASVVMGSVDVYVDEHTVVICDGRAFMGDYSESRSKVEAQPQPDSPVVRVLGLALMGRVNVKRRPGAGWRPCIGLSGVPSVSRFVDLLSRLDARPAKPSWIAQPCDILGYG